MGDWLICVEELQGYKTDSSLNLSKIRLVADTGNFDHYYRPCFLKEIKFASSSKLYEARTVAQQIVYVCWVRSSDSGRALAVAFIDVSYYSDPYCPQLIFTCSLCIFASLWTLTCLCGQSYFCFRVRFSLKCYEWDTAILPLSTFTHFMQTARAGQNYAIDWLQAAEKKLHRAIRLDFPFCSIGIL